MPSDTFLNEIGNYAKGWYGDFTGEGVQAFHDLAKILGHICALAPEYHPSNKDIFQIVTQCFIELSKKSGNPEYFVKEGLVEAVYPSIWFGDKNETPMDARILNAMLRQIRQLNRDAFPDRDMKMNKDIALLFGNGQEMLDRRAECEKEWAKIGKDPLTNFGSY